jgi:hypothetical protein
MLSALETTLADTAVQLCAEQASGSASGQLVGELKAEQAALEGQLAFTAAHLSQEQASHAVARQLLLGSWPTVGLRVGAVFSGGHPVENLLAPVVQPPPI